MAGERVELILELGTEIVSFQIVDLTTEALLLIICYKTCATCSKVWVIVCAVKQVVDAAIS